MIREEVERSPLEVEGFNTKYGLRYLVMNRQYTGSLEPLRHLLPWKRKAPGVTPGMKSKFINSKEELEDKQWCYPRAKPTRKERKMIIARVAEIGTRMIFENFTCQFAEDIFQQKSGGPIGARVTMAAARIYMQHWSREYREILTRSGLRILDLSGYVDDGRVLSSTLRRGMRYDEESRSFKFNEAARLENDELDEANNAL